MNELTLLDLFSGIGGFSLAFQREGFRTIAFCEIEPYAQRVLIKNFGAVMADAEYNGFHQKNGNATESRSDKSKDGSSFRDKPRIYSDITKLDGTQFRGVTVVTGGFPCQPFSVAGKRRGASDHRALWPEMLRVIEQARPAWVLGENVAGIINMELDRCISDLEALGYAVRPFVVPACAVDARHRRDRVWIVANRNGERLEGRNGKELRECFDERIARTSNPSLADNGSHDNGRPDGIGRRIGEQKQSVRDAGGTGWKSNVLQQPECGLGGVADGVSHWMDEPADIPRTSKGDKNRTSRLRGLGNAIVPQVAQVFARAIKQSILST